MSNLPYDAQIEYLEGDGTQYIDTLFQPNQDTRVVCTFSQITSKPNPAPFGCESPRFSAYIINSSFRFDYNSTMTTSSVSVANNTIYTVDFNKNVVYVNNVQATSFNYAQFTAPNLLLFRTTYNGSYLYGRIYTCKIYDDGVLVRDYVPVRVGQVGYLYDKVSEQLFANAGTGSFTLGHDIIEPTPENMVEVEYLEFTGTQWINTGVYGDLNTRVKIQCNTSTDKVIVFGSRESATSKNISAQTGEGLVQVDFGDYSVTRLETAYGDWIEIDNSKSLRSVTTLPNGTPVTNTTAYSTAFTTPETLKIGKWTSNYPAGYTNFIGKIRTVQIWEDNILVRDFIPVRVGGTGYLYDKVSGEFFGNDGVGGFILGKDKALPNPFGFRRRLMIIVELNNHYITDGIVAWWDGIWNVGIDTPHSTSATSWADLSGGGRNMTLTQASWDNDSFVVLQSTQNKATIPSSFSYITCEIITKIDWTTNTQYNEAAVLGGIDGLGFYSQTNVSAYFSDNSGGGFSNKRFGFNYNIDGGVLGIKNSIQYIVGGNTQDSLPSWKAFFNGEEKGMWYAAVGINPYGRGINQRSDRRFAGNVYAIRMYNRMLDNTELRHNLIIDNQRFNLGLTL